MKKMGVCLLDEFDAQIVLDLASSIELYRLPACYLGAVDSCHYEHHSDCVLEVLADLGSPYDFGII